MLEQLGGTQFRKYVLTPEKKKHALAAQPPQNEGWTFLREHGELDKSDLKQLAGSISMSIEMIPPSKVGQNAWYRKLWTLLPMTLPLPSYVPGMT